MVAEAARLLGVHPQTLREWERQGRLHSIRTPGGRRRIPEGEVLRLQGRAAERPSATGEAKGAIYARVSAQDQKARGDLARQIAHLRGRLAQQGVSPVREVSDVASGLSDKRRGLLTLMDLSRRGEITDIAVTYRDRLTRFGFGYLEEFFRGYGVTIHVLDGQPDRKSVQEELLDDMLASVTSFSGKLYGLRSHRRARALVEAVRGHVQEAG